jgi:hypothetical protein
MTKHRGVSARFREYRRPAAFAFLAVAIVLYLMLYKLGSLTGGLNRGEVIIATATYGWHGIYHQPFYLPINVVRSVLYKLVSHHGQTIVRLPDALFGILTIASFAGLLRLWHNTRITLLTGVLFATSAWVLHVSRLASYDVLYLWALPTLLLSVLVLQRVTNKSWLVYVV